MDDGTSRVCLTATADFIAAPAETDSDAISLFRFSVPSRCEHEHYNELRPNEETLAERVKSGDVHPKLKAVSETVFGLWGAEFETRNCKDGILGQTLSGIDKKRQTTQEDVPIYAKSSSQWIRSRLDLTKAAKMAQEEGEELVPTALALNTATLAFALDGALSFIPLSYSHRFLDDADACSSLDFALRLMVDRPSIENWLYQEAHRLT